MANLTSAINIQVDSQTKKEATEILNDLNQSYMLVLKPYEKQTTNIESHSF